MRTPVVVDGRWQVFEVEDARPADKLRGRDCVGYEQILETDVTR